MPKATLKNGVRIHYQQAGQGPDLVLIHGLTGNLAVWHLKIIPLLWDHFRILTYDLRGHGYSDMPPSGYSPTDMAGDLRGLLDELGIEKAALVGHSYGADIALYSALHYPQHVRQVVAIEAALPAMIKFRAQEDWEGWSYWANVLERSGQSVPEEHRFDASYLIRMSLKMPKKWGPLKGLPRNPEPFLRLLDETSVVHDFEEIGELTLENIPRITTPVHLIYAEGSAFQGTCDYLRDRLPNVGATLLPKTEWGHFGPLEQPEVVANHLLNVLASAGPAAGESRGNEIACGVS
jgi:pimeloyl-ACP methyl ester carboxylesterase